MITKHEALAKTDATDEAEFALWAKKIDAALAKFDGSRIYIDAAGLNRRVRDRLIIAYRDTGGWTVEFHDDQRDGASLAFW